jgi:hypothetical protein
MLKSKLINLFFILTLLLISFPQTAIGADLVIVDLQTQITGTNVLVTWRTNEPASGCVQFGLSTDYDLQLCATTSLSTDHRLQLINLNEESFYHFRVVSQDITGQEVISFDGTFETDERSDTTKPEIEKLNLGFVGATQVFLTVETNEETSVTVNYGNSSSNLDKSASSRGKEFVSEIKITRLDLGTKYFYQVVVEDEDGNKEFSSISSWRTSLDKSIEESALRISAVRPVSPQDIQIKETSAVISWQNSRPADGSVRYGTQASRLNKTIKVSNNQIFQSAALNGLEPGTTYYFQIRQTDILNQSATAPNKDGSYSFKTKGNTRVLGAQTSVQQTGQVSVNAQPAILTSLKARSGSRVLGSFTQIYTPASNLIKTLHSPKVYGVLQNKKHWLKNPAIFSSYGYSFSDVRIVSMKELADLPNVTLVKTPDSSTVYYVYPETGLKINIPSAAVFNSYPDNKWGDIVTVSQVDLENIQNAKLIKTSSSPTIYLLEGNLARPFVSVESLERFGYNFNNVVTINTAHLNTIRIGERIE